MTIKDDIWKSTQVAQNYLQGIRGAIPLANEQIQLIHRICKKVVPRAKNFLDLGCGDGILGISLFDIYPSTDGVFIDFSPEMIKTAKQKVPKGHVILSEDYGEEGWYQSIRKCAPFDIIVSGFSIHHQPDERKRTLYKDIFNLLSPGGVFLNLEHVSSLSDLGTVLFEDLFVDATYIFHKGKKTIEEARHEFRNEPDREANILASVEDQCAWLRDVGFLDVDCFFKLLEIAIFGGTKPQK